MKKIADKLSNLEKAFESLELSVATPPTEDRDYGGIIQAFVSVYELTWKTLKAILEENGIEAAFPRVVFEEAFKAKIMEGNSIWKTIIEARNLSTHTYDKKLAADLCARIKKEYVPIFRSTLIKMKKYRMVK